MPIKVEPLPPEVDRSLAMFEAVFKQVRQEFGKFGTVADFHTLVLVARAGEDDPWPGGLTLKQVQRLERVNARGGPGFNMVYEEKSSPWALKLTPRGEAALGRILAAEAAWRDADAEAPKRDVP